MKTSKQLQGRRKERVRSRLRQKNTGRPRLSVFRSGKHIYAQVIDDGQGATLVSASSIDGSLKGKLKNGADKAAAAEVGKLVVLPLEDFSSGEDQTWFAAGMHEALLTAMQQIEGLRVISRTSAMHYRGTEKRIPEIMTLLFEQAESL